MTMADGRTPEYSTKTGSHTAKLLSTHRGVMKVEAQWLDDLDGEWLDGQWVSGAFVLTDGPQVWIDQDTGGNVLSPDDARNLAHMLVWAADVAEQRWTAARSGGSLL